MTDVSDLLAVAHLRGAGQGERLGFVLRLERLTAVMRDDDAIVEHNHGMSSLDTTIANCEKVMQQTRGDLAAVIKARGGK